MGAAFEGGDAALHGLSRRVLAAGILVPGVFSRPFLGVGRGLEDRCHHRARHGLRGLATVDSEGVEMVGRITHENYLDEPARRSRLERKPAWQSRQAG